MLVNTHVATASSDTGHVGASLDGVVSAASLAAAGAAPSSKYEGGGLQGFVLDLPANVDEAAAVKQLAARSDVLRVVPDTWVGIAVAASAY
jgi:hypothetical protein